MIAKNLDEHIKILKKTIKNNETIIKDVAEECIKRLKAGGKIILFGNGGSAADAQHIASELVGSFNDKKRKALPAIALTTDTSALTSISNDYSYENVFKRQLEAFADDKDVIIGISTSGNSKNIINALEYARKKNCFVIGLSGNSGGRMSQFCSKNIIVDTSNTPRIQETHIFIAHSICEIIDNHFIKIKS